MLKYHKSLITLTDLSRTKRYKSVIFKKLQDNGNMVYCYNYYAIKNNI